MRLVALLLLWIPHLCFATWTIAPTTDSRNGTGFEVYYGGALQYAVLPDYYRPGRAEFYYADFINDHGYVAGHIWPVEDLGSNNWHIWADPVAITVDPGGGVATLITGIPAWLNKADWVCFDSYQPFLFNARSGETRQIDGGCGNVDPSSVAEPATGWLLLTAIVAVQIATLARRSPANRAV